MLTDYSPIRLRELFESDDLPAAIAEATEAVDALDDLKADASSEDWAAVDQTSEAWEMALVQLQSRVHRFDSGRRL